MNFGDWYVLEETQEFLSILKKERQLSLEKLRACENWEIYLEKDGFIDGLEYVINLIEETKPTKSEVI